MYFTRKILPKLFLITGCSALAMKRNFFMSQQPLLSEILRGQYENKIRRYSPPEKIFDVFATKRENGRLYMTLHDLLKAICFYNFSICDEKQTEGFNPETILQLVGKKQKFQIYDYFILVRFLAFERKKIENYFQQNIANRSMSKEEFKKYLLNTICDDYNQFIKPPIGLQSRQFKPSYKSFQESVDQTVNSVYQLHPQGFSLNEMIQFRRNMIRELFGFEFLMFKLQQNKIDGSDFARSIVKYVDSRKQKKYMRRIKEKREQMEKIKIGMDSYVGFHYYMQTNIEQLIGELNTHGAVNAEEVFEMINKYVTPSRRVSKEQVQILFKVLDIDDSGFIEKKQFLGVLEKLQYYTHVKSGQLTFTELLHQDWIKAQEKAKKIWEILQE